MARKKEVWPIAYSAKKSCPALFDLPDWRRRPWISGSLILQEVCKRGKKKIKGSEKCLCKVYTEGPAIRFCMQDAFHTRRTCAIVLNKTCHGNLEECASQKAQKFVVNPFTFLFVRHDGFDIQEVPVQTG